MFFRVHVVYVDEGQAVYDWDEETHYKWTQFIIERCNKYGFTYTIIPIEQIFAIREEEIDLQITDPETIKQIEEEKKRDEE